MRYQTAPRPVSFPSRGRLYHFLRLRVVLMRRVFLCLDMARSALAFPFAWSTLLSAIASSHSLTCFSKPPTCFCKFLISTSWTAITLSLSDDDMYLELLDDSGAFEELKRASGEIQGIFRDNKKIVCWGLMCPCEIPTNHWRCYFCGSCNIHRFKAFLKHYPS